jgi:hypothetical protein
MTRTTAAPTCKTCGIDLVPEQTGRATYCANCLASADPRPDLSLDFAPRFNGDGRLIALVSADYRIDRCDSALAAPLAEPTWSAECTSGPRAGGIVGNLGNLRTLDVAIAVCARDSAEHKGAWDARHPATIDVDGLRYVRADTTTQDADDDTYVHLVDADDCRQDYDPTRPGAVIARVVFRDYRRGHVLPARWSLIATGVELTDEETGGHYPDAQWRLADGTAANAGTAAVLTTALDDVTAQRDAFYAADAAMGDPYP